MTMSLRTFGVEIECFSKVSPFISRATNMHFELADALVRANLQVSNAFSGAYDSDYRNWTLKGDCSIRGPGVGLEIVSPILRGTEGLEQIVTVCQILTEKGYQVNNSCGLHVHVGAEDLNAHEVLTIMKRYLANEKLIKSFIKSYRRNSEWCRSPKDDIERIELAASQWETQSNGRWLRHDPMQDATYLSQHSYTRGAVNVSSIRHHGTIEFRQHHASVTSDEITNWVQFLINFIETSREVAPRLATNGQVDKRYKPREDDGALMGLSEDAKNWLYLQAKKFIGPAIRVNAEGFAFATWNRAGTRFVRCSEANAHYAVREDGTMMSLEEVYG